MSIRRNLSKTKSVPYGKIGKPSNVTLPLPNFTVDCKRFRPSIERDVDAALLEWFKQARYLNIPINAKLLMEKAQTLAASMTITTFTATSGFIDRWKKRHGIGKKQVSGEEKSVSEEDIQPWLGLTLPELLSQYAPDYIYKVDETSLFLSCAPTRR